MEENKIANLKVLENSVNPKGLHTLVLNEDSIYYDKNLEVFIRRSNDLKIRVSQNIAEYENLKTYGDCYCMLLDLGVNHKVLKEIFLPEDTEEIDSLCQIRKFAERTQESLQVVNSDFCSEDDIEFLDELKKHPNKLALIYSMEKVSEVITEASDSFEINYSIENNEDMYIHKGITCTDEKDKIIIELGKCAQITQMGSFN